MIVARGSLSILAGAALLALSMLAGCKSISDDTTYPEPPVPVPPAYFFGVWGTGPNDVYVVGQPGLIYHFDGTVWQRQNSTTNQPLTSVWGDPESGRVYVTGHGGVILRSTGDGVWTGMGTGTSEDLYDVGAFTRTRPGGDPHPVLAVGNHGTLLRLNGDSWQRIDGNIMVRDNLNAPADTLTVIHDMVSLTTVFTYGVGGAYLDDRAVGGGIKGCVLLNDPDFDWQLRPISDGESWVTSSVSSPSVAGNYVGTAAGRLFRMSRLAGDVETFSAMFSPSLGEVVYGLWTDPDLAVYSVSDAGRITRVTANNEAHAEVYFDGLTLFDVWGTASDNYYAVGINGRILHYFDAPGDPVGPEWVREVVALPTTKNLDAGGFDKFGRPF
jgi:hypothetical protein